jgi:predicted alpha/beta superfamily hydrolase
MKRTSLILLLALLLFSSLTAQITFVVSQLPPNTSDRVDLFISGTFNNWAPGDKAYQLKKNEDGFFSITLRPAKGKHQFKFTRGSWTTVEGNAQGAFRPDRSILYSGQPQTVYCNIQAWEGTSGGSKSTATSNVVILDPAFHMPQLDQKRKVWIYLPNDYYLSDRSYPVLYLHDGQNVFDENTAFSGEWKVDESLLEIEQQTGRGLIVVAIDNGGSERMAEYSHAPNSRYGGGKGDAYIRFITETLKPFIDQHFRTLPDPQNTGIMGSSLGGLISMYAAVEYSDVFGKAGIFSPSFWYTEGQSYWHVLGEGKKDDLQIYMICGAKEDRGMAPNMLAMKRTMLNLGFTENQVFHKIDEDGQHKEWYWAREFPNAVYWLFKDYFKADSRKVQTPPGIDPIHIQQLSEKEYELAYKTSMAKPKYSIVDETGELVTKPKKLKLSKLPSSNGLEKGVFKIKPPKEGAFYLQIFDEEQLLVVKRFKEEMP